MLTCSPNGTECPRWEFGLIPSSIHLCTIRKSPINTALCNVASSTGWELSDILGALKWPGNQGWLFTIDMYCQSCVQFSRNSPASAMTELAESDFFLIVNTCNWTSVLTPKQAPTPVYRHNYAPEELSNEKRKLFSLLEASSVCHLLKM